MQAEGGIRAEKQRPVHSEGRGCIEADGRKVEGGMNRQEAARQVGMVSRRAETGRQTEAVRPEKTIG
jgi:hypothetical protein